MKILIINHYAGAPSLGMEYRPYYLAREWQKLGHKVKIVAASYHHLRSRQFKLKEKSEIFNVEGVEYLILKTPEYKTNDRKRIINILTFVRLLWGQIRTLSFKFKPDVVIASSTFLFDIFPANAIAKRSKAKLIFEVHDLWPLSPKEMGNYSKWHPFIWTMQLAENYAYRNSDKVVSILPKTMDYMVEHGLKPEKFIYIPNGIFIEEWEVGKSLPLEISTLIEKIRSNKNRIVGYAGNHGIANALEPLVDAMNLLKNDKVELIMIGSGPEKNKLISKARNLELRNIHFVEAIPKTLIPSLLNELDILYIGLQNQPVFRYGISPNKLIDYLMAGKPVIQAIKAGNDITADAKCGISIEPENSMAIFKAVKYLISLPEKELAELGENGHKYCLANHDFKVLSRNFLNAISN